MKKLFLLSLLGLSIFTQAQCADAKYLNPSFKNLCKTVGYSAGALFTGYLSALTLIFACNNPSICLPDSQKLIYPAEFYFTSIGSVCLLATLYLGQKAFQK